MSNLELFSQRNRQNLSNLGHGKIFLRIPCNRTTNNEVIVFEFQNDVLQKVSKKPDRHHVMSKILYNNNIHKYDALKANTKSLINFLQTKDYTNNENDGALMQHFYNSVSEYCRSDVKYYYPSYYNPGGSGERDPDDDPAVTVGDSVDDSVDVEIRPAASTTPASTTHNNKKKGLLSFFARGKSKKHKSKKHKSKKRKSKKRN